MVKGVGLFVRSVPECARIVTFVITIVAAMSTGASPRHAQATTHQHGHGDARRPARGT
jgi:hypothetical protein